MDVLEARQTSRDVDSALGWRLGLFGRMWALAALFHLAGNARDAAASDSWLALASLGLGLVAGATLLAPRLGRLGLLCALIPLTAWFEAPLVGNHWVLATALSFCLLVATALAPRGRRGEPETVWRAFAPAARLSLLLAYVFAAFAKLNTGFLDPVVSCAVFYHNQLVGSWGLALLQVTPGHPLGQGLAVGAAVTELSVAVLLAVPRTRRAGLALALSFHWLLAMDLQQHFWDFSSVLFAGFLLFLDHGQVARLRVLIASGRTRLGVRPAVTRLAVWSGAALTSGLAVLPLGVGFDVLLVLLGHAAWWCYGTAVLLVVLALLRAPRGAEERNVLWPPGGPLLALVPALVVLNGLTPYLELKTGFGWNMYSNLRTVAGDSNHLLVRGTLDLTGLQRDQVRVLDSSDPALRKLGETDYVLPYSEFREYAHAYPEVAVTYERAGQVVTAERLGDDPAGTGGVSAVSQRLQSFRVIDASASERCQPVFTPAR